MQANGDSYQCYLVERLVRLETIHDLQAFRQQSCLPTRQGRLKVNPPSRLGHCQRSFWSVGLTAGNAQHVIRFRR